MWQVAGARAPAASKCRAAHPEEPGPPGPSPGPGPRPQPRPVRSWPPAAASASSAPSTWHRSPRPLPGACVHPPGWAVCPRGQRVSVERRVPKAFSSQSGSLKPELCQPLGAGVRPERCPQAPREAPAPQREGRTESYRAPRSYRARAHRSLVSGPVSDAGSGSSMGPWFAGGTEGERKRGRRGRRCDLWVAPP